MHDVVSHWIDGARAAGSSPRRGPIFQPATGEIAREVALGDVADVDAAVAAAVKAAADWGDSSLSARTRVLFKYRELLDRHRTELAELITAEHGKVLDDAAGEVQRGLEVVEFACGIPQLLKGEHSEQISRGVDSYSVRQPLGVVAGITPFNFPVMVPLWMAPVAIACGNTFVLKPSDRDPSASLRLAELFSEAGLPDGVFNVVQGDAEAVNRLLVHPDVDGVSFVGSTPIARHVYTTATAAGKRVQALGGAKNHMVVLPDADVDLAADAAVSAGYGSAGQRCMAISVLVAVGDTADALVEAVATRTRSLKVGPGTDPASQMGPVVTAAARDRIVAAVESAAAQGARLVVDGRDIDGPAGGFWVGPTLVDHVSPEMRVYTEEIFGPVLAVVRAGTFEEALHLVNSNPYGNGTAIFTENGMAAREFQRRVRAGMVGINVPIPVPMAYHSFGGWKDSLFGDTHIHGPEGVRFYTRAKVTTARWPRTAHGVELGFPTAN
ncbi:CoA-acylating methylmalonate-semialdehyde dehydrogenase [Nocardia transvalensis]|uniref:CoA-acylating methylmalonate-semialdehyde dehydrogenase n=1 Tax=Nocardia transvalensis TaxID=37333 RepID=UPI0018959F6D|nr:CoA-acylating methylmalonate-semialdehyde dehydrogenase [Nocardia transvalensis]MBF6329238.1 CoA-acylating methylmalonate-semialdehyde dehydrogenase [Nocardia transvalensis]